jgi:hypothetical protein
MSVYLKVSSSFCGGPMEGINCFKYYSNRFFLAHLFINLIAVVVYAMRIQAVDY